MFDAVALDVVKKIQQRIAKEKLQTQREDETTLEATTALPDSPDNVTASPEA